jgi:uncharacterized alkaline shock family protein YloU
MSDGYELREPAGTISVTPSALQQIVVRAVESVDGARARRPRRGLEVAVTGERAHVQVELAARYGKVLPELARTTQRQVADALTRICGLDASVDVTVEELRR